MIGAYIVSLKIIMRDELGTRFGVRFEEKLCVLNMVHILYWFSQELLYTEMKNMREEMEG